MDLKTQAVVSNKSQTLKVVDLFDLSNSTKYVLLNVYGNNANSGILYANNKVVPYAKFFPNTASKTIIFELTNNEYVSSTYGKLNDVKFKTSSTANTLNVVTMSTVNSIDPSYYSDNVIGNISYLTNKITPVEYSTAILTSPTVKEPSVQNLIDVAKSYVGQSWNAQKPWDLVESMVAKLGTSLPISSIGYTTDAVSNGKWFLEYDGSKPFGNWKTMLDPGDIVMMSSPGGLTDTVAVVTSGKNESALVIDTAANSKNLTGTTVKILSEHLLTSEDVYDKTDQYHVFIYSLKNSSYTSIKPTNTPSTGLYTTDTPNVPYTLPGKNTDMYITPINDLKFGLNQYFNVPINNVFSTVSKTGQFTTANAYQKVTQSLINLPSWAKYDSITHYISGRTPSQPTKSHVSIVGTIGSETYTDFLDIIVDKNLIVDVQNTIWKAGYNNTIQLNTGIVSPYYMTTNSKLNLSWLHIDANTGTITGIPPLAQIGQSFDVTVTQKASAQSIQSYVDSFTLSIANPINLVGSPINDYQPN